jgi:hypothetical protein
MIQCLWGIHSQGTLQAGIKLTQVCNERTLNRSRLRVSGHNPSGAGLGLDPLGCACVPGEGLSLMGNQSLSTHALDDTETSQICTVTVNIYICGELHT